MATNIYAENPKVSTSFRSTPISKTTNIQVIDPDLSISSLPAGWYEVELYCQFTTEGSVINGFSGEIVDSLGNSFGFLSNGIWDYVKLLDTQAESTPGLGVLVYPSGSSGTNGLKFRGMINNTGGSGIAFKWAQGTLVPSNATRMQTGYIKATKLLDM